MNYLIIAGIVLAFIVFVWDILTDKRKYEKGDYYFNHSKELWMRVALLIPAMICFSLKQDWWIYLIVPFMVGFWYWFLFDGTYNVYVLGKNFFTYIGSVSDTDKKLQKIGWVKALIIKLAGILLFTYLYLK